MPDRAGFSGLDDVCGTCRRRVGDHTMDEYNACLGGVSQDLAYEAIPGGPIPLNVNGAAIPWGDHLTAKACVVAGESVGANLRLSMPAVIFKFQIGNTRGLPIDVAEVGFVGSPEMLRKLGRILRDTCNGAANAAERSA